MDMFTNCAGDNIARTRNIIKTEERFNHINESLASAMDSNSSANGVDGLSWSNLVQQSCNRRPHRRNIVDDGFFSYMANGAIFVSMLEFPQIEPVDPNIIPKRAIPFSKLNAAKPGDCCVFHEKDPMFADYLVFDELRKETQSKVSLFASADCSVYTDMPFCLQIANTYMSRLSAHDLQRHGLLHAPLCRWGDERTYLPYITETPIAFIGLPKHSAVWVGTYGVSKKRADREHLRRGMLEMFRWLEPTRVFIYGPTPRDVFAEIQDATDFVVYPNWTKLMHGGEIHGKQ